MSTSARRLALCVLFLIPGVVIASWVTRTPAIRDALGASTAQMGMVLSGLSVGSMVGILCSAALVARFGTRPIILLGAMCGVASLPLIGVGSVMGLPWLVAIGLGVCGAGIGGGEVAINVDGGEVERLTGRSFLPTMHGFFSLGTTVGALVGMLFAAIEVPVLWHLLSAAVLSLVTALIAIRAIPSGVGRVGRGAAKAAAGARATSLLRDRALLLIGVIILAMALAEGTANDWLPLIMVDGHGFDPAWSSGAFALFAASMTIGRFVGGRFVDRLGRRLILTVSAVSAAVGLAVVSLVDHPTAAVIAVVLWGLGASLGFPVALSAAGDSGPDATARISLVATAGYIAFLVGPPVLGYAGEHFGLRGALLFPLLLVIIALMVIVFTRWDGRPVGDGSPTATGAAAEDPPAATLTPSSASRR